MPPDPLPERRRTRALEDRTQHARDRERTHGAEVEADHQVHGLLVEELEREVQPEQAARSDDREEHRVLLPQDLRGDVVVVVAAVALLPAVGRLAPRDGLLLAQGQGPVAAGVQDRRYEQH